MRSKNSVSGWLTLALALCMVPTLAWADGTVTGVVVDGLTGQPVSGAVLILEGTQISTQTDAAGAFHVAAPAGTYTVTITKDGFDPQQEANVVVTDGGVADIALVLLPTEDAAGAAPAPAAEAGSTPAAGAGGETTGDNAAFKGEVTVSSETDKTSEESLLASRKGAADIIDLIGSEEMGKSIGSDAAAVLQKVTGISVQDGKYVFVRGLGERYSSTTLNGARIPTTEADRRVVPLDLFPAKLLQNINVSKSYTPDKPGEFGGGEVDLSTLDFPLQQTLDLSLGASSRSGTRGESFGRFVGGLSWDGVGGQPAPSILPPERLVPKSFVNPSGFSSEELATIGRGFVGRWSPDVSSAPANMDYSASYGNTVGRLGLMLAAVTAHDYQAVGGEIQRFFALDTGGVFVPRNDYVMNTDTETVRNGLVANLSLRLRDTDKIYLHSMFTRHATSVSRDYTGDNGAAGQVIEDTRDTYRKQDITSVRLGGEHNLSGPWLGSLIDWSATGSRATSETNYRENIFGFQEDGTRYLLVGQPEAGRMEFHELSENLVDGGASWTGFFTFGDSTYGLIKGGLATTNRDRTFAARRFRFVTRDSTQFDLSLSPELLFSEVNIRPGGWEIREQTGVNDAYDGSHRINAVYAMTDLNFGEWRLIGGLRVESSRQEVTTFNPFDTANPVVSVLDTTDPLPAVNAVRRLGPSTNLRLAYSRTVNRPDFRELSPFTFVEVTGGRSISGNPDLKRAVLDSFDVRLETFPRSGEVLAASVFYKKIDQPIERYIQPTSELRTSFTNADSATLWGLELEARRSLDALWSKLHFFSINMNYTYTHSEVTIPDLALSVITNTNRPLEGQSADLANFALQFEQPEWGTVARVGYNYTGRHITDVGAYGLPDIYATSRPDLEVVVSQRLGFADGLTLKLSGANLLNKGYEFRQGEALQQYYQTGRSYGLSLSYSFF